jgi:hypothetical protein
MYVSTTSPPRVLYRFALIQIKICRILPWFAYHLRNFENRNSFRDISKKPYGYMKFYMNYNFHFSKTQKIVKFQICYHHKFKYSSMAYFEKTIEKPFHGSNFNMVFLRNHGMVSHGFESKNSINWKNAKVFLTLFELLLYGKFWKKIHGVTIPW